MFRLSIYLYVFSFLYPILNAMLISFLHILFYKNSKSPITSSKSEIIRFSSSSIRTSCNREWRLGIEGWEIDFKEKRKGRKIGKDFRVFPDKWEEEWAKQLARREKEIMEEGERKKRKEGKDSMPYGHSVHRYMEIAVIADRKFLDFYNNSNFEQYLLTIMNIAADYYHDKSVGNQIDLVIVRMIYLEKEKEEVIRN